MSTEFGGFGGLGGRDTSSSFGSASRANPNPERAEDNVVSPRFTEGDVFTLQIAADEVLSACWTEACKFAANFRSEVVELEHLLLGATYIKSALPALQAATADVAALREALASLCTKQVTAAELDPKRIYKASDALRALLCETGALAAHLSSNKVSLALLLQALKASEPRHAIIGLLSTFDAELKALDAEASREKAALEQLSTQLGQVGAMCRHLIERQQIAAGENQALHASLGQVESRLLTLDTTFTQLPSDEQSLQQDVAMVSEKVSERLSKDAKVWVDQRYAEWKAGREHSPNQAGWFRRLLGS